MGFACSFIYYPSSVATRQLLPEEKPYARRICSGFYRRFDEQNDQSVEFFYKLFEVISSVGEITEAVEACAGG